MSKDKKIIEGRVLSFDKNPFDKDFDLSSLKIQRKRIFVIDGIINSIEEANFNRSDFNNIEVTDYGCLLYTSPSPRDMRRSRMPSSA